MNEINHKLAFVGNMLGKKTGYVTTQGQVVADLFAADGNDVVCVSSRVNRFARLADIIYTLIKERRKYDVVVLEVYSGLNLIMAEAVGRLCGLLKAPLIMALHGGSLPEKAERSPRLLKKVLDRADLLTAPSEYLAQKIGKLGCDIKVVPNVLEIDLYPFRERSRIKPRLIWMRSFHTLYNPLMAVRVLAKLREIEPEATLTMAGADKGLEKDVRKTAADLGVSDFIRFPGFLDPKRKIKEFNDADIFINTNRVDNMPVAVVEACAMGLPVVSTNVGGLPYLISHGENGLLVPDDDCDAMTGAIRSLLEDARLTQSISRSGRNLAERSGWSSVRSEWENLFAAVANKTAAGGAGRMASEFAPPGN